MISSFIDFLFFLDLLINRIQKRLSWKTARILCRMFYRYLCIICTVFIIIKERNGKCSFYWFGGLFNYFFSSDLIVLWDLTLLWDLFMLWDKSLLWDSSLFLSVSSLGSLQPMFDGALTIASIDARRFAKPMYCGTSSRTARATTWQLHGAFETLPRRSGSNWVFLGAAGAALAVIETFKER